jgi:hypothetical protein
MIEPKLPAVRESREMTTQMTRQSQRTNQMLMGSGAMLIAGAVGAYALTQQLVLSSLLAVGGLIALAARQLVRKSIASTAPSDSLQITSVSYRLDEIKKQVSKSKFLESVETEGLTAAQQADLLLQQYKAIRTVLGQKFSPSEIAYDRYLQGLDQACLSIGENLMHIKSQLEVLNLTAGQKTDSWPGLKMQAQELMQVTGQALDRLSDLHRSLLEMTTQEKNRTQLEQTMEQIRDLAERAKKYSSN